MFLQLQASQSFRYITYMCFFVFRYTLTPVILKYFGSVECMNANFGINDKVLLELQERATKLKTKTLMNQISSVSYSTVLLWSSLLQ
jgi:hypothetical protein